MESHLTQVVPIFVISFVASHVKQLVAAVSQVRHSEAHIGQTVSLVS